MECEHKSLLNSRTYDCGQIDVPLDWNNPEIGSIALNFTVLTVKRRIPRKGAVFYHSGALPSFLKQSHTILTSTPSLQDGSTWGIHRPDAQIYTSPKGRTNSIHLHQSMT